MKYFLHTQTRIRLVNGDQELECTPERFAELEPDYPGLPEGATSRYWTQERAYFDGGVMYDGHNCGQYCDKVGAYTQYPVIYANVQLSKTTINACDTQDTITFTASLQDAEAVIMSITYDWLVRLTHETEGDVDRVLLDFVDGVCSKGYTFFPMNPLGTWFLDETKFDLVSYGGTLYEVRLVSPVEFVAYRSL